jgi:hypothetical protein
MSNDANQNIYSKNWRKNKSEYPRRYDGELHATI